MDELQIKEFNLSENDESSDSLFIPGENDPFYQSGHDFNKLPQHV